MFINGRFLTRRTTGVERFAREVIRASSEARFICQNDLLLAPMDVDAPAEFAGIPVTGIGRRRGHAWEQIDLPRYALDETLINLCNTAPVLKRRQLIVLHDASIAAFPHNYTPAFRFWYQAMIRLYSRRACAIATVSRFSAAEIARHFGIPISKLEIIPESGEHILRETPDFSLHQELGLAQDEYFVAVSSRATNKNFATVIKAVATMSAQPFKFVIVGGSNSRVFATIDNAASRAIETGFVTDAQLRALYERAACFVYSSTYEGFGLPPLEAMSCGCPVLVSNAASLPEICGDAAIYCDPHDPADVAKRLKYLLGSAPLREGLRAAGRAHAARWRWPAAARRLQELVRASAY